MAKILDELVHVSFPITKFEEDADGNLIVTGTVTDGSVDSDRQIVDPVWSGKALQDWMESGPNVRVMHSPALYPAGRGLQIELGENAHTLKALVVEDTAKRLVRNKVLRAYSVGIANPVIKRDPTGKAPGGIVAGGQMAEVSLVDRPANKNCQLTLIKSAGSDTPWTYGDLDALLAKAEKDAEATPDLTKKPDSEADTGQSGLIDPDQDNQTGDPDDESRPGSAADEDDDSNDDDTDEAAKAYTAAVTAYKAEEPQRDGAALSGTEYLQKAAAWNRWAQRGEVEHLDGTMTGFTAWAAKAATTKDITLTSPDPAGLVPYNLQGDAPKRKGKQCPDCNAFSKTSAMKCKTCGKAFPGAVAKGAKDCAKCGKTYDADAKMRRCEGCGKKLPKGDMGKVDKGMPAGVDTAGPHREPDGGLVELFERQTGMHTTPDAVPDHTPLSVKGADEAYVVKRIHDAVCAAYDWVDVVDEYPALKSVAEVCDGAWWTDQIPDALAKGDLAGVAFLASAAGTVAQLGNSAPALLEDVRANVHKSFTDMYPTATLHPGEVTPGQFHRPYISAGHASPNASSITRSTPPAAHTINADMYNRPLITAGHEAGSPGAQPDNARLDTVRTGSARSLYTSASKAAAQVAMTAMHDHIATTFPDMCPMAKSADVMPVNMQDTATPTRTELPPSYTAPGEKSAGDVDLYKAVKAAEKAARKAEKAAAIFTAETVLNKSAGGSTITELESTIAELRAQVDELGSQPDPAQAPLRGAVRKAATTDVAPVEKRSLMAEAQDAKAAKETAEEVAFLRMLTKSADPSLRERAEERLDMLLSKAA